LTALASAPQKFFPQTQIDVVQFPEGPGGDTFTEKTIAGRLDVILKDALTFLKNTVIEERVIKHGDHQISATPLRKSSADNRLFSQKPRIENSAQSICANETGALSGHQTD
jgi:hypothetical protein